MVGLTRCRDRCVEALATGTCNCKTYCRAAGELGHLRFRRTYTDGTGRVTAVTGQIGTAHGREIAAWTDLADKWNLEITIRGYSRVADHKFEVEFRRREES